LATGDNLTVVFGSGGQQRIRLMNRSSVLSAFSASSEDNLILSNKRISVFRKPINPGFMAISFAIVE
jgi:hypothetical protein